MKKAKIFKDRVTGRWVLYNGILCTHISFVGAISCLDRDLRRLP